MVEEEHYAVTIEAAVPGSVVLDAQASSGDERRVLNINAGSVVVTLIGLNITGGYMSGLVCARLLNTP